MKLPTRVMRGSVSFYRASEDLLFRERIWYSENSLVG